MAYNSPDKQELIGKVACTSLEEVRLSLIKDKDDDSIKAVDIRTYFRKSETDIDFIATKKGIRIKKCDVADLITILLCNVSDDDEILKALSDNGISYDIVS